MDFINKCLNIDYTQNEALSNKSSLDACLDLFSLGVGSSNKYDLIEKAYSQDPLLTTKIVFYLRDIRNGQGNRDILRTFIKFLFDQKKLEEIVKLIPYIPEIGRWKDIIELIEYNSKIINKTVYSEIYKGFTDITKSGLMAKWLPRQGKIANKLAKMFQITRKEWRQSIVALTNTVEQRMSANKWQDIDYDKVPSIASKIYAKAFKKHDTYRYNQYLDSVLNGTEKIHSSVLYPHQIVSDVLKNISSKKTAEAQWKCLPDYMKDNHFNVLPVVDVSASMEVNIGKGVRAMDIALSLGLYFAEHNKDSYKDIVCTFSSKPSFQKIKGDSLYERIKNLEHIDWGMNINIQVVFDLILANSTSENIPHIVLILSDMEFDQCSSFTQTNYECIKAKYAIKGIKIPTLVFWRISALKSQQPVLKDDIGTILVNGYSPNILASILSGDIKNYTPLGFMLDLLKDRYTYLEKKVGD